MSNDFNFPIYYPLDLLTETMTKSVDISRYAVQDEDRARDRQRIVLSTDAGMSFISQGVTNWQLNIASDQGMSRVNDELPRVVVDAVWYTATEALKHNIRVYSGSDANVFGGMGVLLVPNGFSIPCVMANRENVKFYGLALIENHENFNIRSEQVDILMMKYHYSELYKSEFLLQERGGGGIFVEKHAFPHIHIPVAKECGGYIVIGKKMDAKQFCFSAFQIPYGYALYTPADTIHGDGTLVGDYAITVADASMISADTVLIYNENTLKMANDVVPDWPGRSN